MRQYTNNQLNSSLPKEQAKVLLTRCHPRYQGQVKDYGNQKAK